MDQESRKITYLPAIGFNQDNQVDYFWSDETRPLKVIDTLIIHSMFNKDGDFDEKFDAVACRDLLVDNGVSAHYIIDRMGEIFHLVDLIRGAHHAGLSKMPAPDNRPRVNGFSIGVELLGHENPTDTNYGFTAEQYTSLVWLIGQLLNEVPVKHILGHNDIATAEVRPDPKTDPWGFDWTQFRSLLVKTLDLDQLARLALIGSTMSESDQE